MEVSLQEFQWNPLNGRLLGSSKLFKGFPRSFDVRSHVTGKVTTFTMIGENHPLFDQDGWDGEQSIYESKDYKHIHLVLSHGV